MQEQPTSHPWYEGGLSFTCTQCGRCCGGAPGYVWVSDAEIESLSLAAGLTPEQFADRHTRLVGSRRSLLELDNGDCEFLLRDQDGRAGCSVYASRPMQCRTWPFWQSNLESREDWDLAASDCPGMNTGRHHALPVIQRALQRNVEASLRL